MNGALLGEVTPSLRAATIQWSNEEVSLFFYYDGEVSEEDNESAECVATEVISDFSECALEIDILRWDFPKSIPQKGERVYHRREHSSKSLFIPQTNDFADQPLRIRIILSTIFALINEVSRALNCVIVGSDENTILLCFYYDGVVSEEDNISIKNVCSKVSTDFPTHAIKVDLLLRNYPKKFPQVMEGKAPKCVYLRREQAPETGYA